MASAGPTWSRRQWSQLLSKKESPRAAWIVELKVTGLKPLDHLIRQGIAVPVMSDLVPKRPKREVDF